jgi:hypothetical protein
MKNTGLLALALTVVALVLTIVTAAQLFSGTFDSRSCQTSCVNIIFWPGVVAGVAGFLLGLVSLAKNRLSMAARLSVILGLGLCGFYASLLVVGNFA